MVRAAAAVEPESSSSTRRVGDGVAASPAGSASKPRRKRPSSRPQTQDAQLSNSEATGPETPPRTGSRSKHANTPGADGQTGRSRNKTSQRRGGALKDGYDDSRDAPASSTPAKPIQVYAGPNFHASPAPSSLPIPKMFSKSVPQVNDKTASLKAMMQEDLSEDDSSFSGDNSPTLRSSILASEDRKRDVSPLDVLFRADKEERAQRQGSAEPSMSLRTPPHDRRAQSSSPLSGPSVPPPQRPYDNNVFSMDSDGEVFGSRPSTSSLATPPPQADPAAQARAKTEALKQLLRFSPSPRPPSVPRGPPSRSSSGAFTPPFYDRRNSAQAAMERGGFDAQSRPALFHSPQQRGSYKHPLHEVNSNTDVNESQPRTPPVNRHPSQSSGVPGAAAELNSPGPARSGLSNASQQSSSSTAAMEEQLRKILKLDGFPSPGVRS